MKSSNNLKKIIYTSTPQRDLFCLSTAKVERGFTLIELIVVIGILGILSSIVLIGINNTRQERNLKISKNEMVTNIRKSQSYALSSRNILNTSPARYYIVKFDTVNNPNGYTIQAIDNQTNNVQTVESVKLYSGASIGGLFVQQPTGSNATRPTCVQIAFSLPFGKVYMDTSCNFQNIFNTPESLYQKVNSTLTVWIKAAGTPGASVGQYDKFVNVNGITGTVLGFDSPPTIPNICFNLPNQTC